MAFSIVGNAIFFQSGRHPAPLFWPSGSARHAGEIPAATVPLPVSRPVAKPQPTELADPPPRGQGSEGLAIEPAAQSTAGGPSPIRPLAAKIAAVHKDDPIAQLLRGGEKPPETDARVAAAQRSLEKLGFPVKPDGRMGNSTRQALEKFQRDHHLSNGDGLSPKLLKELATAAGLPPG